MTDYTVPRTALVLSRYDAAVQESPKNLIDREPLLIPQLFVDAPQQPWYRRRATIALAGLSALTIGATTFMVTQFGLAGTAQRLGRGGTAVLEGFVSLVAG